MQENKKIEIPLYSQVLGSRAELFILVLADKLDTISIYPK
jgi:hypothetical protein